MRAGVFKNGVPDEWREYRLVKLTGWTYDELQAQPAHFCDRLLEIEITESEAQADAMKDEGDGF